jgi:hypothetical protein
MAGPHFTIQPNPPVAGQPATVTYTGDSNKVTWQTEGGTPKTVTIPPGIFPIDPVPRGDRLFVDDGTGPPDGAADWRIAQTGGG